FLAFLAGVSSMKIEEILVLFSMDTLAVGAKERITQFLRSNPDWNEFLEKASLEGIGPLTYSHLKQFSNIIPEDVFSRLKGMYIQNAAHNIYIYKGMEPLFADTDGQNIPIAVIKGAHLAQSVYSDSNNRPFVDIDLLVYPLALAGLKEKLEILGFTQETNLNSESGQNSLLEQYWTYRPVYKKDRLFLELHTNFPGLHCPFISEKDLWNNLKTLNFIDAPVPVLSPEYELCLLCLHAQQHSYSRLIWLADIARSVQKENINWNKVMGICRKEGIEASVFWGLHLVGLLWPGTISEHALSRFCIRRMEKWFLRFLWPEKNVISRIAVIDYPMHIPTFLALMRRKKLFSALKILLKIYFPPQGWIVYYYGIPSHSIKIFFHYAWRLYRPIFLVSRKIFKINGVS
ncbi:MAG: nucleotidyltransferase family protein, partial [Candidatus Aminicenantes bacterium]|nr:nucleotidyltransferase family protein [Candidatus Aminicenantes bacterium]